MKCGLLGRKLGHSFSPQIHGALADYRYTLCEKTPEELYDFLKNGDFTGLNVTIPYKKTVIPYCAELSDPSPEDWGGEYHRPAAGPGRCWVTIRTISALPIS